MRHVLRRASVLLLAVPLAGAAAPEVFSAAQLATATRLRDEARRGTLAYEFAAALSQEVGARFAGSPGDAAAVAWAERKLRSLRLPQVWTEPVKVPRWQRGEASGAVVLESGAVRPVTLAALGGSPATAASGGIEAELVQVDTVEALDAMADEVVRGRIVFFSTRMERTRDGSGYGRAVAMRGRGVHRAAAKGAAAVIIRSVTTSDHPVPHTGSARVDDRLPPIPCAALAPPDADFLAAELTRSGAAAKPLRFRLTLRTGLAADAESANVLAELPGRERPEEIVLIGCHLDSWDLGAGAEDDAAGCGIVVETLRRLSALPAAQRPRRTVRAVLYANEEFGLSGARAYARAHEAELPRHVLALEADLGSGQVYSLATRALPAAQPVFDAIAEVLSPLAVAPAPQPARGGADLIPLGAAGVPVADLNQDATRYFDVHHSAADRLEHVQREGLDQAVAAYVATVFLAADSTVAFGPVAPPAAR